MEIEIHMAKQKVHSTTQNFTEIVDILEDIVIFKNRSACSVIEVSSVNFFLLSADEQNSRIYGYMSLLNSLSFPIQIVIISKRVDLSAYIKILDQKVISTQNQQIKEHLALYREFVQALVKGEQLLDKKIYIIIPFSPLELGPITGVATGNIATKMRETIIGKRNNVITQIERIGLFAKVVEGEELARLYYEVFNQEPANIYYKSGDVKNIII